MDYEQLVTVMRRLSIESRRTRSWRFTARYFEVKNKILTKSPVTIGDETEHQNISTSARAVSP